MIHRHLMGNKHFNNLDWVTYQMYIYRHNWAFYSMYCVVILDTSFLYREYQIKFLSSLYVTHVFICWCVWALRFHLSRNLKMNNCHKWQIAILCFTAHGLGHTSRFWPHSNWAGSNDLCDLGYTALKYSQTCYIGKSIC